MCNGALQLPQPETSDVVGNINTSLYKHFGYLQMLITVCVSTKYLGSVAKRWQRIIFNPQPQPMGAITQLYAATAPECADKNGKVGCTAVCTSCISAQQVPAVPRSLGTRGIAKPKGTGPGAWGAVMELAGGRMREVRLDNPISLVFCQLGFHCGKP